MSKQFTDKTRRDFLSRSGKLTLAAGVAATLAGRADGASGAPPRRRRRKKIVPGSPRKSFSRAVKLDDLVFVAGSVGRDARGRISSDFEVQVSQALLNLKASVSASGSSLDQVLKCTCYLKEVRHFSTFNKIYMKFFPQNPPARSTVVVKDLVAPGALLEIDCICYVG